ncbi:MAG: hypothetical protein Kow0037_29030 [Calditrichia bacterium]
MTFSRLRIGLLYFLLFAGGLWHITGYFQNIMRETAGLMMIGLALWLLAEFFLAPETNHGAGITRERIKLVIFSLPVIVITWLVEWAGVQSGLIFGHYHYGDVLQPQIAGVPVAIGFAWLTLLISAAALERKIPGFPLSQSHFTRAARIAALMVVFDLLMEPVAVKLDYWQWSGGHIPLQNYAAWFLISFALAYFTLRFRIQPKKWPQNAIHFYTAQLLYFVLVYFV